MVVICTKLYRRMWISSLLVQGVGYDEYGYIHAATVDVCIASMPVFTAVLLPNNVKRPIECCLPWILTEDKPPA